MQVNFEILRQHVPYLNTSRMRFSLTGAVLRTPLPLSLYACVRVLQLALVVCSSAVQHPHLYLRRVSAICATSTPWRLAGARDLLLAMAHPHTN